MEENPAYTGPAILVTSGPRQRIATLEPAVRQVSKILSLAVVASSSTSIGEAERGTTTLPVKSHQSGCRRMGVSEREEKREPELLLLPGGAVYLFSAVAIRQQQPHQHSNADGPSYRSLLNACTLNEGNSRHIKPIIIDSCTVDLNRPVQPFCPTYQPAILFIRSHPDYPTQKISFSFFIIFFFFFASDKMSSYFLGGRNEGK